MSARPIVWSIAGSDSGGGAGIQADLKALAAFEVHGCTAIAALTAQNSVAVERIEAVAPAMLEAQLAALASDLLPQVVKTGLLASLENVAIVARWIDRLRERGPVALVVDPVRRASSGASFASDELRRAFVEQLLPRATLVTPNRDEAAWLLGVDALAQEQLPEAAARLRALGARAVAITGGDAAGESSLDCIDTPQARGWLSLPRVATAHTHGTGCTYASSAAAALALGFCEADATVLAKMATTAALRDGYAAGQGPGPVQARAGFALQGALLPDLLDRLLDAPATPYAALANADLGLYPVVDSADWVERVLAAGVRTVQLRIKQAAPGHLAQEVARSVAAARAVQAQLFINDHWRLAIEHGAYGVHLGQEDLHTLSAADLAAIRDAGLRLGLSTHSYWEVCRARAHRPSYIACGPIHATTTKDMPWRPQGPDNLAYWCRVLAEPVVAIAGMDEPRSRVAASCGASGIAVVRGIVQAGDPEQAIRRLQQAIAQGRAGAPHPVPALPRPTLAGPVPRD
ncbi:bifunctional hydroxymethylpyrimidine kinase/phosphomethylpyrimidine kinase [Caldimonas thermodepolymerans]|nr:bifunctional hydroxymethylpyrimidine kinase/phosphomethylpyrimidine kinase [Caldimonas thermodepolymerans]QPC33211.1 bifunctional hydroxymethylpyrimidine kinase/phosphomethylpyrimidine kinase [Caldimonas thermodepolymerans]RDH97530.1 thiamine-phosphate diphosphorylase [Caldimonas thermodepolymerans]